MSLQLVINGGVFSTQDYGGISNIFRQVLPRICEQDPLAEVTLFVKARSKANSIPEHERIHIVKTPEWLEKQWAGFGPFSFPPSPDQYKKLYAGTTKGKILHPTYFDVIPGWRGPKVITLYDMIYELRPDWFPDAEQVIKSKEQAIRNADRIFCISESARQDMLTYYKGLDPQKTCVIHLSHSPLFAPRSEFLFEKVDFPFILYVGSRHQRKGAQDLLRAYAIWHGKEEVRLLFVGRGWSPKEVELIHDLALEDRLILKSNISDDGLCDLYNQALAFIYPSLYEGLGIPLLEAMACGCPVVASRIATSVEVGEEIPYFFEPGDKGNLLERLEQALKKSEQDARIRAGRQWAQKYSWDETTQEMLDAYRALT